MINKAIILGNIGKKEIKNTKNNQEMAMLSIATNRKWMDSKGEVKNKTTWHNVVFFDKLSNVIKRYAHVGNLVYIEGEINNKKIESGEREGEYIYSITGDSIKFIHTTKNKNTKSDSHYENDDDDENHEYDAHELI